MKIYNYFKKLSLLNKVIMLSAIVTILAFILDFSNNKNSKTDKQNFNTVGCMRNVYIDSGNYTDTSGKADHIVNDTPRDRLIEIGIPWSPDKFLDAIREGDLLAVELFIEGGMTPYLENTSKLLLPVQLAANNLNPDEVLNILISKYKNFDVNHVYSQKPFGGFTLINMSVEGENLSLIKSLVKHGVDLYKKVEFQVQWNGNIYHKIQDTPLNYAKEKYRRHGSSNKKLKEIIDFLNKNAPGSDSEKPAQQSTINDLRMDMQKFQSEASKRAMDEYYESLR
jgi:hypothetical protein